jgi:uncharacterized protein involved in exopolysaccharide biosynthesis
MATETKPRARGKPEPPALDEEQEVDLGRYWGALVARWWLPLAGILAGIILGYLVSLGGGQVYQAKAVIYLGQPLSTGGVPVQWVGSNPATVTQIVNAESTLRAVAKQAHIPVSELRGQISATTVSSGTAASAARAGQSPLVTIVVKGKAPGAVNRAADALAAIVVQDVSRFVNVKIKSLQTLLASENREFKSINARINELQNAIQNGQSLSPIERLLLSNQIGFAEQERTQIVTQQSQTQQLLLTAQNVELSQLLTRPVAVKVTARSRRNSMLVGAFIGLILGILAALLWDPVSRVARRPAV